MVEQSPATVPGSSGDTAGSHPPADRLPQQTGSPADRSDAAPGSRSASDLPQGHRARTPTPAGSARDAPESERAAQAGHATAASSVADLSRRLGEALARLVHARVWPGPWAGDEPDAPSRAVAASSRGPGRTDVQASARRRRPARLSARDLPLSALRSDVWTPSTSQRALHLQQQPEPRRRAADGRRIRLPWRGPSDYAIWEATGIVGACLLLTGRPGPLVARQIEPADLPTCAPGASDDLQGATAPPPADGPEVPWRDARDAQDTRLRARIRSAWPLSRRRRDVRGLRWAAALGFDIVPARTPRATASSDVVPGGTRHRVGRQAEPPGSGEVDLCLVRATALTEDTVTIRYLHALLCDAARDVRAGGLVLATLRLTPGLACGFGGAELRGLVAGLDEAGLTVVGDLDGSRLDDRGPAGPNHEGQNHDDLARGARVDVAPAVVRLLLRRRGARVG